MDKRTEMIAQPHWKTLAVQLLIWSSLLPFHKDTRVLPWLQTYLCHLNCLGFHHKDDQIESNSFFRAQIIKHNFSLICLKNVFCLKLTVLYLLRGIIAFWEATEVSLSRVCTLQVRPWTDNLLVVLEKEGGKPDWKKSSASWNFRHWNEQHDSGLSNHLVAKLSSTKRQWSPVIPPVW